MGRYCRPPYQSTHLPWSVPVQRQQCPAEPSASYRAYDGVQYRLFKFCLGPGCISTYEHMRISLREMLYQYSSEKTKVDTYDNELNIRFILNLLAEPCAPKPREYAGAHTSKRDACMASRRVRKAMGAPSRRRQTVKRGMEEAVAMAASFRRYLSARSLLTTSSPKAWHPDPLADPL